MYQIRPSTERDQARILDIWREAVDATHDFLTDVDRAAIECEVSTLFAQVNLLVAVNESDTPEGFIFLHQGHLEALFVDPARHGQGIGKALVQRALAEYPHLTTDVNEQNPKALAFYKRGSNIDGAHDHDSVTTRESLTEEAGESGYCQQKNVMHQADEVKYLACPVERSRDTINEQYLAHQ